MMYTIVTYSIVWKIASSKFLFDTCLPKIIFTCFVLIIFQKFYTNNEYFHNIISTKLNQ